MASFIELDKAVVRVIRLLVFCDYGLSVSLSRVQLFATPWTVAYQASLSMFL